MELARFKARVQRAAFVLMAVTSVYLLYYWYKSIGRAWRFSIGEPEQWQTHWRVDDGVVIEMATRSLYFAIWIGVILSSTVAVLAALYLLDRARRGLWFDAGTARAIQWVGGLLVVSMIADTGFGMVDLHLITRHNEGGPEPIAFFYDPTDFKTAALAMVLFMFGWVMRAGIEIEQTNKEYV